ncbi:MAG: hypothetical protein EOM12_13960 [Verrucomicrobiae bacterium]|nr:hypothetical protein [Verrucomicrobiae bacterium]
MFGMFKKKNQLTSPFEPKPELQSEQGLRNYLKKLSSLDHATLCVEFACVRAAKHNLMLVPAGPNNFREVQTLVTDLNDKTLAICVLAFGQPAVFGYSGGDLRSFNELVDEIDDNVASLNLEPEQHGKQLLKKLGKHLRLA